MRRTGRASARPASPAVRRSAMKRAVVALAGVCALALAAVSILAGVAAFALAAGKSRYDAGQYSASARAYELATHAMPDALGRWKAYFGAGTARLKAGEAAAAIEDLTRALDLVTAQASPAEQDPSGEQDPPAEEREVSDECKVRINLAIATMAVAADESDPALAAAGYADAVSIIAPCQDEESMKVGKQAQESQNDAEEEAARQEAERRGEQGQEADQGEPGEDSQDSEGEAGEQDRELLERMSEAERERREWDEYDKKFGSKNGENW